MVRLIQAPGIELNEIDRSAYTDLIDNSMVDTTTFVAGFADKGLDYAVNYVNSLTAFLNLYGTPTNEAERYFYNAAAAIFENGGRVLASKLPYNNKSKDKFTYVDYLINTDESALISLSNVCVFNDTTFREYVDSLYKVIDNLIKTEHILIPPYKSKATILEEIKSLRPKGTFKELRELIEYIFTYIEAQLPQIDSSVDLINSNKTLNECRIALQSLQYDIASEDINLESIDSSLSSAIPIRSRLNSYQDIELSDTTLLELSTLDNYLANYYTISPLCADTIRIIDISRNKFDKCLMKVSHCLSTITVSSDAKRIEFDKFLKKNKQLSATTDWITHSDSLSSKSVKYERQEKYVGMECLGVMPVLVSPLNALFYQHIISEFENTCPICGTVNEKIAEYQLLLKRNAILGNVISKARKFQEYYATPSEEIFFNIKDDQLDTQFYVNKFSQQYSNSVSEIATSYFPSINYLQEKTVDREYMKLIGVVVFKVMKNSGNSSHINFVPVESFVGSLDRTATDVYTKLSIFIDKIVNSASKYIRLFSSLRSDKLTWKNASTIFIGNQTGTILGFTEEQSKKHITLEESIIKPLRYIYSKLENPNQYPIDIICDAGLTNIGLWAGFFKHKFNTDYKEDVEPIEHIEKHFPGYLFYSPENLDYPAEICEATNSFIKTSAEGSTLKQVLQLSYNRVVNMICSFAKDVRKDCIALIDGPRQLVLNGYEKRVRPTNVYASIKNNILPYLDNIIKVNTSYAAGYLDWYLCPDRYSNTYMWTPPSIKMLGVYLYTDIYAHSWDAPAGLNRGRIKDAIDISFNPNISEAGVIYNHAWNYALNYPVEGIVAEGQKTFQLRKTAFDRVNVRRLFLNLEKRVKRVAKFFVYEPNTEYLRQRFVDSIRPIFEDAVHGGGIVEYYIKCDNENNTTLTIENNELRCTIAVKPVKTLEFLVLNFICTNQSSNVTEETVRT